METMTTEMENKESSAAIKYKMVFEGEVAKKFMELSEELKSRGVDPKGLTQLVAEELSQKAQSYWDKWLEEVTPIKFYLNYAQNDPDHEVKLMRFLKQIHQARVKGISSKRENKGDVQGSANDLSLDDEES